MNDPQKTDIQTGLLCFHELTRVVDTFLHVLTSLHRFAFARVCTSLYKHPQALSRSFQWFCVCMFCVPIVQRPSFGMVKASVYCVMLLHLFHLLATRQTMMNLDNRSWQPLIIWSFRFCETVWASIDKCWQVLASVGKHGYVFGHALK